ncbi:MAG: hypothetical protein ACOX0W_05645 [Sphaerochaetaceae bacterium]
MKKFVPIIVLALLLFVVLLSSCEESNGETTLTLRMINGASGARYVISPAGEGLEITSYTVHGKGPNGNTFSLSSHSPLIEVNGLVVGTWNITVNGLNQQGRNIATGEASHHLTIRNNTLDITLDQFYGEGDVDVNFYWEDPTYPNVEFELTLTPQNGESITVLEGLTISEATASARYQQHLPAGSYDLTYALYSNQIRIAGGVVALRIIDNKLSSTEIPIIINKVTGDASGLNISSDISSPIEGSIGLLANRQLPNQDIKAHFEYSRGGGSPSLFVDWYLDGEYIGEGDDITFNTHTGFHRLDALVQSSKLGSLASESTTFEASVSSLGGVPHLVSSIQQGESDPFGSTYRLMGVNSALFLRDGKLLTASEEGFQLSKIVHDRPVVLKDFPMGTQYPTEGVTKMVFDHDLNLLFTFSKEIGTLALYSYEPESNSLQLIDKYEAYEGYWEKELVEAMIDVVNKELYVLDRNSNLFYTSYSPFEIEEFDQLILGETIYPSFAALSDSGKHMTLISDFSNEFVLYEIRLNPVYNVKRFYEFVRQSPSSGDALSAAFIGNKYVTFSTTGMKLFSESPSSGWNNGVNILGSLQHVPYATHFDPINNRGYLAFNDPSSKVVKVNLINESPVEVEGEMTHPSVEGNHLAYSPKGNFLAITGDNSLHLLRISDD